MLKRMLILALALMLACLPALAETTEPQPLEQGVTLTVDLDGDGTEESVLWEMAAGQYEDVLMVTVTGASGARTTYPTDILWGGVVYVVDLNGDGAMEILLSGDVMSDDYFTWCLRWDGEGLYEVLFPDISRGSNTNGYFPTGYGRITAIEGRRVALSGSQDVLGTWFGERTLALSPHDRFELDDDGLWVREPFQMDEAELWEYAAVTLTQPLDYMDEAGNPAGTLAAGEKLIISATDKQSRVLFYTQGGITGALAISPNHEKDWGWLVDGIPEDECFNNLLYAD